LRGYEITSRTDYLINGASDCLLFSSARKIGTGKDDDRVFWCRATDGGRQFVFGGWIVPPDDQFRAVMPTTVRLSATELVTAIRRRRSNNKCWVDAYSSDDNGRTWRLQGKVGDTGASNGNPPALILLKDGRLCCAYGNRSNNQILARVSDDKGKNWQKEIVVRDGYMPDKHGDADFGYPRMFQREDGRIVTIYYWADQERPQPHIAATIWNLPGA
jgi:Neuraminidase (sialidase)